MRGRVTVSARKNGKNGNMVTPVGALKWPQVKKVKTVGEMRSGDRAFLRSLIDLDSINHWAMH